MNIHCELINDLADGLISQGLEVESYYPESGPGQQEVNIRYADAAQAADRQIIYRETVRGLATRHGLDLVSVDYLQRVAASDGRKRYDVVTEVSMRICEVARATNTHALCAAQLNRESDSRKGPPMLSDLKGSGQLEQDAHNVILLHRPHKDEAGLDTWAVAMVAKQKNGPTGPVHLSWDGPSVAFGDCDRRNG